MGKISEVYYGQVDTEVYSPEQAAESYFYENLVDIDDMFDEGYCKTMSDQIEIRNSMLNNVCNSDDLNSIPTHRHPRLNTSIIAISPLCEKVVVIVEY